MPNRGYKFMIEFLKKSMTFVELVTGLSIGMDCSVYKMYFVDFVSIDIINFYAYFYVVELTSILNKQLMYRCLVCVLV